MAYTEVPQSFWRSPWVGFSDRNGPHFLLADYGELSDGHCANIYAAAKVFNCEVSAVTMVKGLGTWENGEWTLRSRS